MKKVMFFALMLLVLGKIGRAEEAPTVRYLMTDTVTRLDYGLGRLEKSIKDCANPLFDVDKIGPIVSAYYDWDAKRIKIDLIYFPNLKVFQNDQKNHRKSQKELDNIKLHMKVVIDNVKYSLRVDPEIGKPFGNKQYSILAHYFSHSIFKSAKEPNISATGLDKITEIKVEHISKRMKIQCQSLLLSNDIFCSQESLKP